VSLGDVDGDGDLDAFVASFPANRVWLNDGSGIFIQSNNNLGNLASLGVSLGDVDGVIWMPLWRILVNLTGCG